MAPTRQQPDGNPNGIVAVRERDGSVTLGPPARARWAIDRVPTGDGHELAVTFTATVHGIDEATERRALGEVLLAGREAVTADDVEAHFAPVLRRALTTAAKPRPAGHWLTDAGHDELLAALRAAAKPVAFACGVDVVGPFEVLVDSPTLRATADQRRRAAVAQQESVERLKRIATAADALRAAGDLPAAALMAAVRAEDRGETLRGLLKAQADAAAPAVVWAVAGTSLVRVDPTTGAAAAVHVSFPPELGPLRSVTSAIYEHRDVLLVGGRGGVAVVSDAATAPRADFYRADVGDSPYGFNSAATVDGGHLYACHADAGLVVWPIGSKPPSTVVDVRNARNLVSLSDGGAYAFSVGHEVRVATRDGSARPVDAGGADVVALLPTLGRLTVVREDGALTVLDAATFAPTWIGRRTGRLCAATTLHWSGGDRLLLATEDGPVVACGLTDDDVVTHYASGHRGLRAIAASPQVVAAASADRQRLVLWNAWDGQAPVAEVNVARVIGNRVTDVAVL